MACAVGWLPVPVPHHYGPSWQDISSGVRDPRHGTGRIYSHYLHRDVRANCRWKKRDCLHSHSMTQGKRHYLRASSRDIPESVRTRRLSDKSDGNKHCSCNEGLNRIIIISGWGMARGQGGTPCRCKHVLVIGVYINSIHVADMIQERVHISWSNRPTSLYWPVLQ